MVLMMDQSSRLIYGLYNAILVGVKGNGGLYLQGIVNS